jgi:toxin FitB
LKGYLIDTNILSKLAPGKANLAPEARDWFAREGNRLFLSVVTVAEIEKGMRALHRRGGVERAFKINNWLNEILERFGERLLAVDPIVARIAGALEEHARSQGHDPGFADILIAATAKAYDLAVVTENTQHFAPLGVDVYLPETFRN